MAIFNRGKSAAVEVLPVGQHRAQAAPYNAPRAISASAERIRLTDRHQVEQTRRRESSTALWQITAWQCYDNVGEVNYAFNYSGSVLSRVRMHAAVVISPDSAPIEVTDAVRVQTDEYGSTEGTSNGIDPRLAQRAIHFMDQLGGIGGKAPMLKAFALNIQVAGECYLACLDNRWGVHSTSEIRIDAGGRAIWQPSIATASVVPKYLTPGAPIGRIWNRHPRFSADPDSSLRAVLADCEELILLARLMRVAARSRLNAGILLIPDTLSAAARDIGSNDPDNDVEVEEDLDPFEKELFDSMTAPIAQEDSGSAIVPLVVRGPAEEIDKVKYIQMSRDVGADLASRSAAVLVRVLQGINAPKELSTPGSSSAAATRYSQMMDEQSYKALVEPMALMFADAVSEVYLQPLLRADIEIQEWAKDNPDITKQIERIVCWYDPSEVVTSVDQSASATIGYNAKILSNAAWRKANGFSENDAPSEKELAQRLVLSQVALPPNVQQQLLQLTLPEVFEKLQSLNEAANGVGLPSDLQQMLGQSSTVNPSPQVPATSAPADVPAS